MTEAELYPLYPLLSKPSQDEEDEIEDKVIQQTKANGLEESPAAKEEKSTFKKDHVHPLLNMYADLAWQTKETKN
jgi:hypothetical protein